MSNAAALETTTVTVTLPKLAKMIDHSLLHPTMTDADIHASLEIAKAYKVATACVKPYSIPQAKSVLGFGNVGICPVIGFPHGNSTTEVKIFETERAIIMGGTEIDMVINIGKALSGDWDYVYHEIASINGVVTMNHAILKVIFENDYLQDEHIIRLCEICSRLSVAFIKTSTGYGFVKQPDGAYNYAGATIRQLKLMREHAKPSVQIKAAGGIRTLDDMLKMVALGVTRVGATATVAILEEAVRRGIGETPVTIDVVIQLDAIAVGV